MHRQALVVDESTSERQGCIEVLTTLGYTTHEACTAEEGLEKMKAQAYAVVFLAIEMPGSPLDGLGCIEAFRSWEAANRSSSRQLVCCVTAKDEVSAKQVLAAGMDDLITKCYSTKQIKAVMAHRDTALPGSPLIAGGASTVESTTQRQDAWVKSMSRTTWMDNGGKEADFNLVDSNGDGVVDRNEAQVLDMSLWDAATAKKMTASLHLKDPEPLFFFLSQAGNKLKSYTLQTTTEEREETWQYLEITVGLAERDAKKLERQMCRWTVMRMRMGRPAAFADAFEESDDDYD